MQKLNPHRSNSSHNFSVLYEIKKGPNSLSVNFLVKNLLKKWNVDHSFSTTDYNNLGLWNFDVVEVFLKEIDTRQETNEFNYTEFEFSPLNQILCLEIIRPREEFFIRSDIILKSKSSYTTDEWHLQTEIPIKTEKQYKGSLFAALGPLGMREYFAIKPNQDFKPDFHQPNNFISFE